MLDEFELGFVRSFARPALNLFWCDMLDSAGLPPTELEFDESTFIEPYLPSVLEPRPFTMVNLEDPGAPPQVVMLKPKPDGSWEEVEVEVEEEVGEEGSSAYETATTGGSQDGSSPSHPAVAASGGAATSSDASSVWSSDPQSSPERVAGVPSTPCTPATRAIRTLSGLSSPSPRS